MKLNGEQRRILIYLYFKFLLHITSIINFLKNFFKLQAISVWQKMKTSTVL
jgi:cytochrome c oxidase subunit IV